MDITLIELKKRVIREAKRLKKHATEEELNKLDFKVLNPVDQYNCIYGQMTRGCFSERATGLIKVSCDAVFQCAGENISKGYGLEGGADRDPKIARRFNYFSPIEVFIARPINGRNGNNKKLISFLKGETKTLKFR